MQIIWPDNHDFALTIIDDTDNSTIENTKPVYDFLNKLGFRTTKTIWIYPPRDYYCGSACLQEQDYHKFIMDLEYKGFEITMHSVGSGSFTRKEILEGYNQYKETYGHFPNIHTNHSKNPDNVYWNPRDRFNSIVSIIVEISNLVKRNRIRFTGHIPGNKHFWGDFAKENIKYFRNLTFNEINLLKVDPQIPYRRHHTDTFSNYWFSSSDGHTVAEFSDLISQENIDKLEKEKGVSIIYTHFAEGFIKNGELDPIFKERMMYLAEKNGWFVPTGKILDFLLNRKDSSEFVDKKYLTRLEIKWIRDRVIKKFKYKR